MIEDFTARRRAVIERQRLLLEEMKAEDERDYQIHCAEQEFEDWLERERVKRQKYEQAMLEKRLARGMGAEEEKKEEHYDGQSG
jgi:hypothetical protein